MRVWLSLEQERVRRNVAKAVKKGAPVGLTIEQWLKIMHHFNFRCAFCKKGKAETMEHLDRLCRGGGTHRFNVVPSCAKCNQQNASTLLRIDNTKQVLVELWS